MRRVDRQMFELKRTNAINDLAKDFRTSKDFFGVVAKDKKGFEILESFRKAIYLNREINAKKNCFEDKTTTNFYLANIRATTLTFLIVVEF